MNERPIPEAAMRDKDSVEMLRVWIAERQLHCSIKVGMYLARTTIPEEKAWGVILADVTRHIAMALDGAYSADVLQSIQKIRENFLSELDKPTSATVGQIS